LIVGNTHAAPCRHLGAHGLAVRRRKHARGEREDFRIFDGNVVAVQLCQLVEQG